jgi:hypothetical protein
MRFKPFAVGIAFLLLATLVASVDVAQRATPSPGLVLSAGTLMVAEGSAGHAYTVALATRPLAEVTIAIAGAGEELSLSTTRLVFDATDWNQPQSVGVSVAKDDTLLEGTHSFTLTHTASSLDPSYGGSEAAGRAPMDASLTVLVADNDFGVAVVQSDGSTVVKEDPTLPDAKDQLVVSLGSAPSGPVTVRLVPSDGLQLILDRFTVGFTPSNWFVPVTVKASAILDDVAEGTQSRAITVTASGGGFDGISLSIPVTILDDDVAGLRFTDASGGALPEVPSVSAAPGAETNPVSYKVGLRSQPTGAVTVALSAPGGQATVSPSVLTFGPSDWNPKTVTVAAVDDRVDEGTNSDALTVDVLHEVSSGDAAYGALPDAALAFRYFDDDDAGYVFDALSRDTLPAALSVAEATPTVAATYTLHLSSQPTADVNVSFAGNDQIAVSPGWSIFTPANWNAPVAVSVAAKDDPFDEPEPQTTYVSQAVSSADANYRSVPGPVPVTVTDDDHAAVQVQMATGLSVTEGGPSKVVQVRLGSQPVGDVAVAVASEAGQATATPAGLSFSTGDWNEWQSVTVAAADDTQTEFTATDNITLDPSSDADPVYDTLATVRVPVVVLDDDGVGVLEESDGSTVVQEGGASDTYTLRLMSKPSDAVRITVKAPAGLLVNGAGSVTLTFDPDLPDQSTDLLSTTDSLLGTLGLGPADLGTVHQAAGSPWNQPQAIRVSAPDDGDVTGSLALAVTHTAESADPDYDGALIRPVLARRLDNDAGILIEESDGSTAVSEGGLADTYTVRLATAPREGVALTLRHDAQVSLSDAALFFDAYSWDEPQTVTVAAVDDAVHEANAASTVSHTVRTNDGLYASLTARDVLVMVTDNDP